MESPIRVLTTGDFQKGSGLTNYILNTYDHFNSDQYQIDCMSISPSDDLKESILNRGWGYYRVTPVTVSPIKHFFDWRTFLKNRGKYYDVIHFNYSASWNYFAIKMAKRYSNAKIIIHSHNNYYSKKPKSWLSKFVLDTLNNHGRQVIKKNSDLNLAVSNEAKDWMFKPSEEVFIQKNGIELSNFVFDKDSRKELRSELGIEDHTNIIGFAGVLSDRKNPLFAVEMYAKFLPLHPDSVFLIFGNGRDEKQVVERVKELQLTDKIIFMGRKLNLNKWYSAIDVFIFPSKTEGFGFVLLETQVNGLPIVCSQGIPSEAIQTDSVCQLSFDDENGWLTGLNNRISIAERQENSKKNAAIIQKNGYSISATATELAQLIEDLVKKG